MGSDTEAGRPPLAPDCCVECGRGFVRRHPRQRFCGRRCKWKHWERAHPRMVRWTGPRSPAGGAGCAADPPPPEERAS